MFLTRNRRLRLVVSPAELRTERLDEPDAFARNAICGRKPWRPVNLTRTTPTERTISQAFAVVNADTLAFNGPAEAGGIGNDAQFQRARATSAAVVSIVKPADWAPAS
jgi:hypothetical protein